MAENSAIEWTDHTLNFWIGCTALTPAYDHCYAETWGHRFGVEWGVGKERRLASASTLRQPFAWNREAERRGCRFKVFSNSLSDFGDAEVPDAWRDRAVDEVISQTPHLDWLILTKRANVMLRYWEKRGGVPANVWQGVTVENQTTADQRIPLLLQIPAKVRFLSCEPLLGPLNLAGWLRDPSNEECGDCDDGEGYARHRCSRTDIPREEQCPNNRAVFTPCEWPPFADDGTPASLTMEREVANWIIAGGESGPHARPTHPDWIRSLRDQCQVAGTAFHFKQHGEWAPAPEIIEAKGSSFHRFPNGTWMQRVGKRDAGRLLDGVEWSQFPAARIAATAYEIADAMMAERDKGEAK